MIEDRSIEQQVADSILEKRKTVELNGKVYTIAPPTLATVIMISELVSQLPPAPKKNDKRLNILQEVLKNGKDSKVIGKIIAVLILGAKRVSENRQFPKNTKKHSYFSRIFRWIVPKSKRRETIAEVDNLAEIVLNEVSPAQANDIVASTLIQLQIPDFFALTTSLTTTNQLKPTREVVTEATASGE